MFVPESTPNRIKVYEQKNAIQKDNKLGSYYISNDKFNSMIGFTVEPGDIIVSCAGTIGEIYTLPQDAEIGIINQALMRIRLFYKPIENYFLMYFDSVLKKEAIEKGNGTGMKNIPPFDILKKMLIPIPPEKEIERMLNKIYSISTYINKINNSNKFINEICLSIKSKILNYFFGENSSYKSYYENYKKIGNLFYPISTLNKEEKTKDVLPIGKFPVVSQSRCLIDGYSNSDNKVVNETPVIIFGDHTRIVKYVDFPFIPGADGTKILKSKELDDKYFYFCVLYASLKIENRGYGRHFSRLKEILVPIPFIDKQIEIVAYIEDAFNLLKSIT